MVDKTPEPSQEELWIVREYEKKKASEPVQHEKAMTIAVIGENVRLWIECEHGNETRI